MMFAASWPWEWSASAWSALTFLVLVGAAMLTWRQVKEAQRLREEQARPFVVIDFHPFRTIIEIRITNIGTTLARDVKFEISPPLSSTHDDNATMGPIRELNVFKNGIPSLAPGREIKLFFDQFPARVGKELPLTYDVKLTYTDPTGRRFEEPTVLDLSMYVGTGGITRHGLHDIHKQLKDISDNIKRWTDFSGLKVLTRADLKQRSAEWDAEDAEREKTASHGADSEGETPNSDEGEHHRQHTSGSSAG